MTWNKSKYYIKGTGIIIICLLLILLSCYGIATNENELARTIFYIVYLSLSGGVLIAYWVYAFILEKRKVREEEKDKRLGQQKSKKDE